MPSWVSRSPRSSARWDLLFVHGPMVLIRVGTVPRAPPGVPPLDFSIALLPAAAEATGPFLGIRACREGLVGGCFLAEVGVEVMAGAARALSHTPLIVTPPLRQALLKIQGGEVDVMIAGGTEAAVTPLTFAGFTQMRARAILFAQKALGGSISCILRVLEGSGRFNLSYLTCLEGSGRFNL